MFELLYAKAIGLVQLKGQINLHKTRSGVLRTPEAGWPEKALVDPVRELRKKRRQFRIKS